MTVAQLSAVMQRVFVEERIGAAPDSGQVGCYAEIVDDLLAGRARHVGDAFVVGVCGSQGSGKSTMARVLEAALKEIHGLSVATLSLDDLYLASSERARLAREVHPLLKTRGVPGTHHVALGIDVICGLTANSTNRANDASEATRVPRFDKALDEPFPAEKWPLFQGRADVVIFEGWCVGAVAQDERALVEPVNALEQEFDPEGRWRRYVNQQLEGPYRELFGLIDRLVMLRAPGFAVVFEWRREQERKLAAKFGAGDPAARRVMSDDELRRFVMHYERLTRHILEEMPARADVLVTLDERRSIVSLSRKPAATDALSPSRA